MSSRFTYHSADKAGRCWMRHDLRRGHKRQLRKERCTRRLLHDVILVRWQPIDRLVDRKIIERYHART
jgi:hypothetical protein